MGLLWSRSLQSGVVENLGTARMRLRGGLATWDGEVETWTFPHVDDFDEFLLNHICLGDHPMWLDICLGTLWQSVE